jgi:hypothetical protein
MDMGIGVGKQKRRRMKTHIHVVLIGFYIILSCSGPLAYGETSVSTGVRYDTFSDDQSPKGRGTELTLPFGVLCKQERWLLRLEAAYGRANVDSGTDADAEISSFTDTLLAGSYTFPDLPVGVVVGLDLNLPTGKERLDNNEYKAEAGERHDLFEVDNFGEGINVGLNLGLVKELGPLNVGLSGTYIFKGKYDPMEDIADDDLDPGDQTLVFGLLNWKVTSWFRLETLVAYSHFAQAKIGGRKSYQEGDKIVLNGNVRLQRHPVELTIGVQNALQGNNKELLGDTLKTEPANSNGIEVFGWFDLTYKVSSKLDLQALGDIRHYGESDRKSELNGLPFEGKRLRYAVGPGALYVLNEHVSCNVLAKFFLMEQKRNFLQEQDVTFRGVNVSVGMTYMF